MTGDVYELRRQVDDLRLENERLRKEMDDRWTAQQSCCQSWITSHRCAVERAERAEAEVERWRERALQADAEAAKERAARDGDLVARVEAKMHDVEFLGRLRRLIAQERGVLDQLACWCPVDSDALGYQHTWSRKVEDCPLHGGSRPLWDDPDVIDVVADTLWDQNCERNCLAPQPRPDSWGLDDALMILRRVGLDERDDDR